MTGLGFYVQKFSALSRWQLVKPAYLAAIGYLVFSALGLLTGLPVEPADVLPLYGLLVLDEMGCRMRRTPHPFIVCGAVLSLIAGMINALAF